MKKVININFQGRVIPIEESAFELLKNYIDSLKRYFSNEEGKDEIINDIESRIAELFSEILKKGSSCIVEDDVNTIINTMGRPEDFEAEEGNNDYHSSYKEEAEPKNYTSTGGEQMHRGRFYRDADDQIIGGVCSGLANYLGVDPVLIRIFAVVFFTFFFWIYLLLWLIVPSKSTERNVTKRLFRDLENKWIGGVCSGIANFFNANPQIVRFAFLVPFLIWLLSGRAGDLSSINGIQDFPSLITGSFGLGLAFIYAVLWIALPVARTTSDKLEMRGERVDVNNIQKKVKEEMESFKGRSHKIADEVRQAANNFSKRAQEFGEELGESASRASEVFKERASSASEQFRTGSATTANTAKSTAKKAGSVIGGLAKIIVMFVVACLVFAIFASVLGVTAGVFAFWPFMQFILAKPWHYTLYFITIIFFILVPLIALVIYFVKRLSGSRTGKGTSVAFGVMWGIGWIALFALIPVLINEFKISVSEEQKMEIVQPKGPLTVQIKDIREFRRNANVTFTGFNNSDFFLYRDTLVIKSNRIAVAPAKDGQYAVSFVKQSMGRSFDDALERAQNIRPKASQNGDEIMVSNKMFIASKELFRGQELLMVVSVPVGKEIMFSNDWDYDSWMYIWQVNNISSFEYMKHNHQWKDMRYNKIYVMTENGLVEKEELLKEKQAPAEKAPVKKDSVITTATEVKETQEVKKDSTKPAQQVYEYPGNE
jgi:phage shock protein PspC (stress-responsive transcriptional regulator)